MQYRLDNQSLYVRPESREEAKRLNQVEQLCSPEDEPEQYAAWLAWHSEGKEEVLLKDKYLDVYDSTERAPKREYKPVDRNRPNVYEKQLLQTSVLEPYLKRFTEWTGDTALADQALEVTSVWPCLGHGFTMRRAYLLGNGYIDYVGYVSISSSKETPETAAEYLLDQVVEDLGQRWTEREYREADNGHMMRNPHYLRHHQAVSGFGQFYNDHHHALWHLLWDRWLKNKASDAYKEALGRILGYRGKKMCGHPELDDSHVYLRDPKGTCAYDYEGTMAAVMKPEDMRKLQGGQPCKESTVTSAGSS